MSEVNFNSLNNNYGYYQTAQKQVKKDEKAEVQAEAPKKEAISADKMLDVMSLMGAQNFASIQAKSEVDPAKFLSDDRISDIENSMVEFEAGIEEFVAAFKAEFGDAIGESAMYSLAADAFAAFED